MRILSVLILFFSTSLFAQYSSEDYKLIRTTFDRQFDKEIIKSYLHSDNDQQTRAALLTIANSNDTAWIREVTQLDFNLYSDEIAFTLGKLGRSDHSTKFLLDHIDSNLASPANPAVISNIGKTGSAEDLQYLDSAYFQYDGYPTAVFNFFTRNINNQNSIKILTSLLDTTKINSGSQFEILFALYRIGPSIDGLMKYVKFAASENLNNKLYSLACLRKLEGFPDDMDLMRDILQHSDWRVRVEGAKTCSYKRFNSIEEIKVLTSLLYDLNPNVSRTTASSIRNINVQARTKKNLDELLVSLLDSRGFNKNTIGELFVSYCALFPAEIQNKIDTYEDKVEPEFIHAALTQNTEDPEWNFDYLVDQFKDANEVQLMSLIPPILALQPRLIEDPDYTDLVLSLYSGGYPAPIALLSYGLDTVFVQRNQEMFQQLIVEQTFKYLNNPLYAESLLAFPVLAGKVSESFQETILNTLKSSKITSVANSAGRTLSKDFEPSSKDSLVFETIWANAFKFSSAVVSTSKGNFTIELSAEYSPISTGNFCYLAENKFFENIVFHRVVPNFVIQTGDPSSTGWGGPGYEIVSEYSWLKYDEAAVGMASAGRDTEGSQWFVMHSYHPHLNGNYSLFGTVTQGMSVVSKIDQGDKILNISLKK